MSVGNAALLVCAVIFSLTKRREEGIKGEGIREGDIREGGFERIILLKPILNIN